MARAEIRVSLRDISKSVCEIVVFESCFVVL